MNQAQTINTTEYYIDDLEELVSAEDFLDYFNIPFEASVVHVNRLHILQRYHDYLGQAESSMPSEDDEAAYMMSHRGLLEKAYQDFVVSDALTEKVFKVFKMHEPKTTFVPLSDLME